MTKLKNMGLAAVIATTPWIASAAFAQAVDVQDSTKLPCTIEEIFAKYEAATKRQADALRDQKNQELIDPENRADRATNRLNKGNEVSVEGGSTTHRISLHLPKVRMGRKSMDVPETYFEETTILIPDGVKTCRTGGMIKIDLPCGVHQREVKTKVTQWRMKTIYFDLPLAIDWEQADIIYDTPNITQRDNRHELNEAKGNIQRILRELQDGSRAIADHSVAAFIDEASKNVAEAEERALANFDKQAEAKLAPFSQIRADIYTKRNVARATAGDRMGEVDAAFAKALVPVDQAEAETRGKIAEQRNSVSQQFADLREALKKSSLSCVKDS